MHAERERDARSFGRTCARVRTLKIAYLHIGLITCKHVRAHMNTHIFRLSFFLYLFWLVSISLFAFLSISPSQSLSHIVFHSLLYGKVGVVHVLTSQ